MIKEIVVKFEDGTEKSFSSFEEAIEKTVGIEELPETEDTEEIKEETPEVANVEATPEV